MNSTRMAAVVLVGSLGGCQQVTLPTLRRAHITRLLRATDATDVMAGSTVRSRIFGREVAPGRTLTINAFGHDAVFVRLRIGNSREVENLNLHWCSTASVSVRRRELCVLVVEDEAVIRELVSEALRDAGHDVVEVTNGVEAIKVLDDPPRGFYAVVTDFHMPGAIDGAQVAAVARRAFPEIMVVITSARHDVLRSTWRETLGYTLLRKPFALSTIVGIVNDRPIGDSR